MQVLLTIRLVVCGGLVVCSLGAIIGAFPFMWAWNYIVPALFGLRRIGALEAFCLIWVFTVLFKTTISKDAK